ncbi:PREDICTED: myrosinase 1-like [Papilio xuthus]|uniref:Myrosinase 1-like n=1 Tax=Papilio xuthus TaxID=66420 RepID=A0AAJ7E7A3_PAPXU|nr:PREDICTED: myrosinase 1-like [Papilio xuthus]
MASKVVRKLPDDLKLGVATAAFQIEGAWSEADKSPSIWDNFCHIPGKIKDGTTADDACKSYNFYKRDIEMLKYLGVDFYRFSISWPRILPNGFADKISESGIEYYNKLIDELLSNKIEPVVTMYHWDLPQNLQDLGGWTNPLMADWFEEYSRVLYKSFGDRIKTWITINEPKQIGLFGYGLKRFAPGINAHGIGEYIAAKNIVLAHAKAWHVYDKEFREKQKGVCGITIATDFREGATSSPADIDAGLDAIQFEVGLYAHPIFSDEGGFPDRVKRLVNKRSKEQGYPKSRLPEFTKDEIEFVKGTSDFYGFNHYSTKFYTRVGFERGMYPEPSYDDDIGAIASYLDYEQGAIPHVTVIPQGIRKALKWVKESYNNPPIMITENGYGTLGGIEDYDRISYFKKYLNCILDAIEIDHCNVLSYTAWSLMDNFEWDSGLSIKFGLFQVDYEDDRRKRTARSSAMWYRNLLSTKTLNLDHVPVLEDISF